MREITAKHLFNIACRLDEYINPHKPSDQSSHLKTAWFSTVSSLFHLLFTSELLHAVIQDFSSRFGTVGRIVNFLIGHCCIVTEMYYFHVFLSLSVLSLSRGAFLVRCRHIQSMRCEYQIEFASKYLLSLSGQITHKMMSKWSSWQVSS